MPDEKRVFTKFKPAEITKVEEQVLMGVLDIRLNNGVWEKLVPIRRVLWAGERQHIERGQAWRPVAVVSIDKPDTRFPRL